jgi:Terpene cyclase DEP1
MKLRHLYLVFCLFGLLLPYSQLIPWIIEHRAFNMPLFMHDLFANRICAFFALDVIVSAIVLLSFIQTEGRRLRIRLLWLPMLGTLFVGLPLFLSLRQLQLDRAAVYN